MPNLNYSIEEVVESGIKKSSVLDLSEIELNLLSLITLIIDIEYRYVSNPSFDERNTSDYIKDMNNLPDQTILVEQVLEGSQRGLLA